MCLSSNKKALSFWEKASLNLKLFQTLYQSISRAESDYVRTFGVDAWKRTMAHNFSAASFDDDRDDQPSAQDSAPHTSREADESAEEGINLVNKN